MVIKNVLAFALGVPRWCSVFEIMALLMFFFFSCLGASQQGSNGNVCDDNLRHLIEVFGVMNVL